MEFFSGNNFFIVLKLYYAPYLLDKTVKAA